MNVENLSTEAILEELKKRKVQEVMLINEKIAEMTPKFVENPDLTGLMSICADYIQEEIDNGWVDDDTYRLREIEKLKKESL